MPSAPGPSSALEPHVLPEIVQVLATAATIRRVLVAIDGVDGAGKTSLAFDLASKVRALGRPVVLIQVDDFMHVSHVRHRRGRTSPLGYFLDSYDYEALETQALQPLSSPGWAEYRAAVTDRYLDQRVNSPVLSAAENAVVIIEGLFLLRDELLDWWDYSIFVTTDGPTALQRKALRDELRIDSDSALGRRYRDGQRLYLESCRPMERATWLVEPVPLDEAGVDHS